MLNKVGLVSSRVPGPSRERRREIMEADIHYTPELKASYSSPACTNLPPRHLSEGTSLRQDWEIYDFNFAISVERELRGQTLARSVIVSALSYWDSAIDSERTHIKQRFALRLPYAFGALQCDSGIHPVRVRSSRCDDLNPARINRRWIVFFK